MYQIARGQHDSAGVNKAELGNKVQEVEKNLGLQVITRLDMKNRPSLEDFEQKNDMKIGIFETQLITIVS